MLFLCLVISILQLSTISWTKEYNFKIDYDRTDWPGVETPWSGKEINLMNVHNHAEPNQIHLSFTENPTEMWLMWTTNNVDHINEVRYGLLEDDLNYTAWAYYNNYTWFDGYTSGYNHKALLVNLVAGRKHYYQIIANGRKSSVISFVAAPDENSPVSIFHTGDTGIFGSSVMVTKTMLENSKKQDYHGVIHCGDLSYADKYQGAVPQSGWAKQEMWDTYFAMVEPLAKSMAYMVTPGNHEIDFPDSSGENMTSYMRRFSLPGNMRYYSFPIGMVHFVSVSSDESVDPASTQGRWLDKKLAELNMNRDKWPWIVTFQHRPIYNSNANHGNWTGTNNWDTPGWEYPDKNGWPNDYEKLLIKHNVDIVLNGHVHQYERTWPVKNRSQVTKSYNDVKDPIHVICGHGGAKLYKWVWDTDNTVNTFGNHTPEYVSARDNEHWGHCEFQFIDRNTVRHKMYKMGESEPTEDITITKHHSLSNDLGKDPCSVLIVALHLLLQMLFVI